MTRYTIDSQVTYTTEEVSRKEFLQFIASNDCYGLIHYLGRDNKGCWTASEGLCFSDEDFDWEHYFDEECIEPQCIAERLGTEGPQITEWNIFWSDEGYPIAQAVVGEW